MAPDSTGFKLELGDADLLSDDHGTVPLGILARKVAGCMVPELPHIYVCSQGCSVYRNMYNCITATRAGGSPRLTQPRGECRGRADSRARARLPGRSLRVVYPRW